MLPLLFAYPLGLAFTTFWVLFDGVTVTWPEEYSNSLWCIEYLAAAVDAELLLWRFVAVVRGLRWQDAYAYSLVQYFDPNLRAMLWIFSYVGSSLI